MYLRLEPEEYAELCQKVLQRDKWRCRNCGFRSELHVHHIVYRSLGGDDSLENLLVLCARCHDGIHVDEQDGVMGLVIATPCNANEKVHFIWAPGWRP